MKESCFFAGHRDAPESLESILRETVEFHVNHYGVTTFYVGSYGKFDRMAANAVAKVKLNYPKVKLYLALAFHPTARNIEFDNIFDGSYFPEGQETAPPRVAIPRLNRRMVDESQYLITYVRYISGGSYKLLEYAQRRSEQGKITITNIGQT